MDFVDLIVDSKLPVQLHDHIPSPMGWMNANYVIGCTTTTKIGQYQFVSIRL